MALGWCLEWISHPLDYILSYFLASKGDSFGSYPVKMQIDLKLSAWTDLSSLCGPISRSPFIIWGSDGNTLLTLAEMHLDTI